MNKLKDDDLVACIVEGKTEKIILEMLLDNNLLFFDKSNLLDNKILEGKYRNPKTFTKKYLNLNYEDNDLYLIVIKDDKKDFKINSPYDRNIKQKIIVSSAPEIEILMIIALGKYDEYTKKYKSKIKPSLYLKQFIFKNQNVKDEEFIKDFYNSNSLKDAIKSYDSKTRNSNSIKTLYDLFM